MYCVNIKQIFIYSYMFFQENCTYATIGGTCFRKKTHVELFMTIPRNVWKLGEKIPVHVECSVKGGSLEVDKVFEQFYDI